jgi:uncharacterized protein DUF3300
LERYDWNELGAKEIGFHPEEANDPNVRETACLSGTLFAAGRCHNPIGRRRSAVRARAVARIFGIRGASVCGELQQITAPIALYPDALVAQILGASGTTPRVIDFQGQEFAVGAPTLVSALLTRALISVRHFSAQSWFSGPEDDVNLIGT